LYQQCSRADRTDDICRRVCNQNQPHIGGVFLHGPPQGCLSIPSQVVGLIDDNDLEALFGGDVNLPTSEGMISRWKMEETMLNSSLLLVMVWKTRASILF
jgi:hypothetical protein